MCCGGWREEIVAPKPEGFLCGQRRVHTQNCGPVSESVIKGYQSPVNKVLYNHTCGSPYTHPMLPAASYPLHPAPVCASPWSTHQIEGTMMWTPLVPQLWHDLQKCPHLWETPLFLWFYCFALSFQFSVPIGNSRMFMKPLGSFFTPGPHWCCPKSYQVTDQLSNWQNLRSCPWACRILLFCSLWLEKLLLFSSRDGKNRNFWRQFWHLGFTAPLYKPCQPDNFCWSKCTLEMEHFDAQGLELPILLQHWLCYASTCGYRCMHLHSVCETSLILNL